MDNHRLQYAPPPPHHHQHTQFCNHNFGAPYEMHQQELVGAAAAGPVPYHYHGVFPGYISQNFVSCVPTNTVPPPQYHHQLLHEQNGNGTYINSGPNVGLVAAYGISSPTSSAPQGVTLPNGENPFRTNTNGEANIRQPVLCEVCVIACDTKAVLDKHMLGKQHRKKLAKIGGPVPGNANHNTWLCEVCEIGCNTKAVLDNHMLGKKHMKNLAKIGGLTNPNPLKGNANHNTWRCEVCMIGCNTKDVLDIHMSGKKHKKNLAIMK